MTDNDKHTSLPWYGNDYDSIKFYGARLRACTIKLIATVIDAVS